MELVPKLNKILSYSFGRSSDLLSGPILDVMYYLLKNEALNQLVQVVKSSQRLQFLIFFM